MNTQTTPLVGCLWYAERMNWTLLRGNVMVEGNTDVRYFHRAAQLYLASSGRSLMYKDLSIFAAGTGEAGGTYGIAEKYPTLFNLARVDVDQNAKMKYRTVALLDSDSAGKAAVRVMCQANRSLQENAHLFLLHREMPRKSRDAKPLTQHIKDENLKYVGLECVIEDLVDATFCDLYAEANPQHVEGKTHTVVDGHHRRWTQDGKFGLCKYVEQYAGVEEVVRIVEVLKSLRFYLGLDPDGVR